MSRQRVAIDMVAFRRDVEMGTTTLALAEKYGIARSTACRLKAEISGKVARRELGPMPDPEADDTPPVYELTLDLPTARLDDLIQTLSDSELRAAVMEMNHQDKAFLFQLALQQRFNCYDSHPETETSDNG